MKNRIIYIVAVWLLGTIAAFAENSLSADNISMTAGDTVELKINMKNDVNVAGLGFTLTLPEGLSLVLDKDKSLVYTQNPDRAKSTKFSVFSAAQGNNTYSVRIMPTSTSVIQGNDGWILSLKLHADAKMKDETSQVELTKSSFTVKGEDNSLKTLPLEDILFSVSVKKKEQEDVKKNNYFYADDINMIAGKTVALDVKLKNELTVAGLGFTLKLPEGLSLMVDSDNDLVYTLNPDRAMSSKFSVYYNISDPKDEVGIRIIPTTTTNVKGSDGTILSLQLHADEQMAENTYQIQLTENSISVKDGNNALRTADLKDTTVNVKVKVVKEVEGAIKFADENVKAICIANWDTNADEELTEEEAAKITTIGSVFKGNTNIKSFDELSYFKALTTIDKNAFAGCTNLTSVELPESLTKIGETAFNGCTKLTSITIPEKVTYLGKEAFSGCTDLASIDMPNTITTVGEGTFDKTAWYNNLPDGVVYVGKVAYNYKGTMPANTNIQVKEGTIGFTDNAFAGCTGLKSVTIPEGVTSIGISVFEGCTGLTSVQMPNSLISIGEDAFSECKSLTTVVIPNDVKTIGQYAFSWCTGLTSVKIGSSLAAIEDRAFLGCSSLSSVVSQIVNPFTFGNYAFDGISTACKLTVPYGTREKYIAKGWTEEVFKGGIYEEGVEIKEILFADASVKAICVANWDTNGDGLFSEEEVAAVKSLGSVFYGNTKITSFNELKYFTGLTTIDKNAFSGCTSLTSIELPTDITKIGDSAFKGCSALTSITIPEGVISIGSNVFYDCTGLMSIDLPESLTKIGDSSFKYCSSLTSISIPDAVETIGVSTFYGCTSLTSIKLPKSLKKIDDSVFRGCFNLASIVISDDVKAIDTQAFRDCSSLTEITIPSNVTSIGADAFKGCLNLSSVVSEIKKPFAFGTDAFASISASCKLTVPSGTRGSYITAGWTKDVFKGGIYEVGEEIKEIIFADAGVKALCVANWDTNGDGLFSEEEAAAVKDVGEVFKGNKEITSFDELQYFTGLTTIGKSAFESCTKLTSIIIPKNVTSIGVGAFANCSGLTSISVADGNRIYDSRNNCNAIIETQSNKLIAGCKYTVIPNDVTAIGESAFEGCTGLVSVEIPDNVKKIENSSFNGCVGLTTINIGSGVESIGSQAFANCVKLSDVYCYAENAPNTQSDAFKGLNIESAVLHVSESALSAYQNVQPWSNFSKIVKILQEFILTFVIDGEIYRTYKVEGGSTIIPPYAPIKEGYTCEWVDLPETMPAHDVTVTGSYTINKYKVTYVVDGVEYKSSELEFGTEITPEAAPKKDGYTFSGWSEIPGTVPAHDVIITGSFSVNKYKLIYVVDDVEYKTIEVDYGATITPEVAPTREGYTFSGWSEIPTTMPAHDVTITGTFSKGAYKLIYEVDGVVYKTISYDYGATITAEAAPTREGYTFGGWSEIPTTMPARDVTVTGTFSINSYKITYVVDGTEYKSTSVVYGKAITPEADPKKEGYTFSGWSAIPETMPAKDVTVTGTFSINRYKLIYKVDGAEYKSYEIEYGATITAEAEPTKEGYSFSGWGEIPTTMPAHDVTISGTFSKGAYKLIYEVDGVVYKTISYDYGATITPEAAPTREGYTFSGWSEIPGTMPAHDVTISGTFSKGVYKLIYEVDGVVYKTISYDYGATITPEAAPTREGYTFSGWSEIPTTMPAHDVTVTGSFSKGTYKLTYVVDGKVYKTVGYDLDAHITPEPSPTKEGYTFDGWVDLPETMPAHDVTVTGSYTINKYKVSYVVDGVEYKSAELAYGTEITPEADPKKVGYTFSGWSEIPGTVPAHDVTVTGSFSINKYKLIYVVDDVEYQSVEIEYGSSITPIDEPSKTGYIFSGWVGLPETMPAYDVTVTGSFSKGTYKLTYVVDSKVYKTVGYDLDAHITPEPSPTKEGYTFNGWVDLPETMPAHDVTVTGSFAINKYKLIYMVDDKVYESYEVEYGTELKPITEPSKEGYTFSGWSDMPETMPSHDVTVIGSFSINTYIITYLIDGVEYGTSEFEYGAEVNPIREPSKEGYTFSGWQNLPDEMPARDITITGTFVVNKYKITYVVNGAEYKTASIEYGSTITPESAPTKEGYSFTGWVGLPETMPAHDVTVTGSYTINKYIIIYIVDGVEYGTSEIEYGADVNPIGEPSKEGYTFSGWQNLPDYMPAHDVTVSGAFTVNKYKVTFMYGDNVLTTIEVNYGAVIELPTSLNSNRYTLVEWLDVPDTMPAHDIIIYAGYVDGIETITADRKDKQYIRISGMYTNDLKQGLNIIRTQDGKTMKVWVK